jgi:hypothetical protein
MSGLSEVSRLFAARAGDLEKAREIFTAETRSYVSAILAAIQRTRGEPWLSARTRIDFPSEIETGAKNGSLANQYASARVTLRFKKGTKFMPVADVVEGAEKRSRSLVARGDTQRGRAGFRCRFGRRLHGARNARRDPSDKGLDGSPNAAPGV